MNVKFLVSFFHKWIGVIVGIQILLWVAGGFVMTFFHIDQVRGDHNRREAVPVGLPPLEELVPIASIQEARGDNVARVTLRNLLDKHVYIISRIEDGPVMVDARTGQVLSPISEGLARSVALADFSGDGKILEAEIYNEEHYEVRGRKGLWRIVFDDAENTRLYIDPHEGRVLARRNDTWRLFDFFWMLHIMDYETRDNFNNPLVISTATASFLFVLSGFAMAALRLRRRDWKVLSNMLRKSNKAK